MSVSPLEAVPPQRRRWGRRRLNWGCLAIAVFLAAGWAVVIVALMRWL